MCKFDAEIKSYKDGKTILIYQNHYLPCTYNSKPCRYVCNCYYCDRAVHISVAVDMRTLLDRKNYSSSSNGQVAAHRVTGLIIIKRLWLYYDLDWSILKIFCSKPLSGCYCHHKYVCPLVWFTIRANFSQRAL